MRERKTVRTAIGEFSPKLSANVIEKNNEIRQLFLDDLHSLGIDPATIATLIVDPDSSHSRIVRSRRTDGTAPIESVTVGPDTADNATIAAMLALDARIPYSVAPFITTKADDELARMGSFLWSAIVSGLSIRMHAEHGNYARIVDFLGHCYDEAFDRIDEFADVYDAVDALTAAGKKQKAEQKNSELVLRHFDAAAAAIRCILAAAVCGKTLGDAAYSEMASALYGPINREGRNLLSHIRKMGERFFERRQIAFSDIVAIAALVGEFFWFDVTTTNHDGELRLTMR